MFGFAIPVKSIWIYDDPLFFVNNKVLYFCTLQTMHLPLGFPFYLFSLIASQTTNKHTNKQTNKQKIDRNKSHKGFLNENRCMYIGMETSKTSWTRITPKYFHTILCHFGICAHHKTLYMHLASSHPLKENTALSNAHSTVLIPHIHMCHVHQRQNFKA